MRQWQRPSSCFLLLGLLIAVGLAPAVSEAQPRRAQSHVQIDVKTTMEEKHELTTIKHSVIEAIEAARWASVVETGEDYSLWVAAERRRRGQVAGDVTLELRTPAMITRGDFITNRRARYQVEPARVERATRKYRPMLRNEVQSGLESCRTVRKFVDAAAALQTGGANLLAEGFDFCGFMARLAEAFQPEPIDLVIADEIGGQTLVRLRDMLDMPPLPRRSGERGYERETPDGGSYSGGARPGRGEAGGTEASRLYVLTTRASEEVPFPLIERLDAQTEKATREAGFTVPRELWERSTGRPVLRVHYQLQRREGEAGQLAIRAAHLTPASSAGGSERAYHTAWTDSARVPADLSAESRAREALRELLEGFFRQAGR